MAGTEALQLRQESPRRGTIDAIGAKDILIPLIRDAYMPGAKKLNAAQRTERLIWLREMGRPEVPPWITNRHTEQTLESVQLLSQAVRRRTNTLTAKGAIVDGDTYLSGERNQIIRDETIAGFNSLTHAYRSDISGSVVTGGYNVLGSGLGFLVRCSPLEISFILETAQAILSGDDSQYRDLIREFSKTKSKDPIWRAYAASECGRAANQPKNPLYPFLKYGADAYEAYYLNYLLEQAIHGGDTFGVQMKNSVAVGYRSVFGKAVGGKIENSILASCEEIPLNDAIDIHVINSYLISPDGQVEYVKNSRRGLYAGEINWHGFPDFKNKKAKA
jgi:hypothetical protein